MDKINFLRCYILAMFRKVSKQRNRIYLQGMFYVSVSQPPSRGPVPGPGINYNGPREVLLEFVIFH